MSANWIIARLGSRPAAAIIGLVGLLASGLAAAQTAVAVDRYGIADTVSPEARAALTSLYARLSKRPTLPRPETLAEWDRRATFAEKLYGGGFQKTVDDLKLTVTDEKMAGVSVLRIRPANLKSGRRVLIYAHGGAYTLFSPRTAFSAAAATSAATGFEVISIAYTLAPRATWREVTDQVVSVYKFILAAGSPPASVGIFGDSAGGGLAAGSVLKMRDEGLPLPGALWLISPEADIGAVGDSFLTLTAADPVLAPEASRWSAEAYAARSDWKNPYVSPVYGDYAKAFPPTLIQVGTREMLLSNSVREYQAIRSGGHEAVLDVYEGMPHNFQLTIPATPEARTALARGAAFFEAHLRKR